MCSSQKINGHCHWTKMQMTWVWDIIRMWSARGVFVCTMFFSTMFFSVSHSKTSWRWLWSIEKSFRIKHYFFILLLCASVKIFSKFLLCNRTLFSLNRFRENYRVKTVLYRYQMYIVTLQFNCIDIVMKVQLCIFSLIATVPQNSVFSYHRFLVSICKSLRFSS